MTLSYVVSYFQEKARLWELQASSQSSEYLVETDSSSCLFLSLRSLITSVVVENGIVVLFISETRLSTLLASENAIDIHND